MTAIRILDEFSKQGKNIFISQDLETIFANESSRTLQKSLNRFVTSGILKRITKGVYVNGRASLGAYPLESLALNIRRGEYNYISLESALSQYGVISQIPVDRLTIMSTGRSGEFITPRGVIDITHTGRKPADILHGTIKGRGPMRLVKKETALRDLKHAGRNTLLILSGEL